MQLGNNTKVENKTRIHSTSSMIDARSREGRGVRPERARTVVRGREMVLLACLILFRFLFGLVLNLDLGCPLTRSITL